MVSLLLSEFYFIVLHFFDFVNYFQPRKITVFLIILIFVRL
jgi:hypothetical protein